MHIGVDGFHVSILDTKEIYGTNAISKYRYSLKISTDSAEIEIFNKNRKKIGLLPFDKEIELIDMIYR